MPVTLGDVGIWVFSRALDDAGKVAAQLEEMGYRAVWLGAASPDLEVVSRMLDATEQLVVATGIVSIWTESAPTLAVNWHRVTRGHPARFLLGLGVSHAPIVEQAGHSYERPYGKMVAYLDALDQATPPVPKEDRVLAALGPRMLRLSGERSAGAHPYLVPVEHTRRARAILGPGPLLAPELMAVLDTDAGRAREIARATLSRYLQPPDSTSGRRLPNYTSNLLRLGYTEEDFVGGGSDRLVDAIVARGTVEDVEARVREHLDAGADHVSVQVLTAPGAAGPPAPPLDQWRELAPVLVG